MVINIEDKNIVLFGTGAVGKSVLHYLEKFFKVDPERLYMYDLDDYKDHPLVKYWTDKGSTFMKRDVNKAYRGIMKNLNQFDIVIDLTSRTNSDKFIQEAKKHNLHYINTSLEVDGSINEEKRNHEKFETTYQSAHNDVHETSKTFPQHQATILCEHGMNPGLIQSFFKEGILFMADNIKPKKNDALFNLAKTHKDFAKLCEMLQIDTIHCSETDSTIFTDEKDHKDKFNNTWCVQGLLDEASANSEFSYGSEELLMPKKSGLLYDNIICLNEPANDTYCESFVPIDNKIIGTVISHGEGISMGAYLKTPTHSCTIHYVYKYSPLTYDSMSTLNSKMMGGTIPNPHVVNNYDDKIKGIDRVGGLLLTRKGKAVWAGSMADNTCDEYTSGTLIQVVAGVLSGLSYMIENPQEGILFPEDLDHEYILKKAKPYLGTCKCEFVNYKPKSIQFMDLKRSKQDFDKQFKK